MNNRKTLQDLTLKDTFMFAAVMMNTEICRRFLEMILLISIDKIVVDTEKSIFHNPRSHGVRLDVYAKDDQRRHYNVEMQVRKQDVPKRGRYYHAQMDCLLAGESYDTLPDTYVIFICDFDPFGLGKYQYTVQKVFKEASDYVYNDGSHSIFLNTRGNNPDDVPAELIHFLDFVRTGSVVAEDDYVQLLNTTIEQIKVQREMREKFMLLEEYLREEKAESKAQGLAEGRAEGLAEGKAQDRIEVIKLLLSNKFRPSMDYLENLALPTDIIKLEVLTQSVIDASNLQEFEEKIEAMK